MAAPTVQQWKKSKTHEITLASGFKCKVEVPNLPYLIKKGEIPNALVDVTVKAAQGVLTVDRELLEQQDEFARKMVSVTVVEPKVEESEVHELPYEDVELIVEIATRQRDVDAVGHHLGGLETVEEFRRFRGLTNGNEDLAGL